MTSESIRPTGIFVILFSYANGILVVQKIEDSGATGYLFFAGQFLGQLNKYLAVG